MRTLARNPQSTEQLTYWIGRFERFSADDSRDLSLLRSIESALDIFRDMQKFVELFAGIFRKEGDKLVAMPAGQMFDKDGTLLHKLFKAQTSLKKHYNDLYSWREEVKVRSTFVGEDEIIEECSSYLNALSHIHNYVNDLRWKIADHDADYASKTGSFKTVKELAKHLNSQHS